jgi:uncharacterized membrane protein YcaP (DUF421 family)
MFEEPLIYSSLEPIIRIVIQGILGFIGLVIILKNSGKRTLTKMNAFDLVITLTYSSIFANLMMNPKTTLVQAIVAFSLLTLMQMVVAYLSVRSKSFANMVKSSPTLLLHEGKILHDVLKRERLLEEELCASLRSSGFADFKNVHAAVLETNGDISVIGRKNDNIVKSTVDNFVKNDEDVGN